MNTFTQVPHPVAHGSRRDRILQGVLDHDYAGVYALAASFDDLDRAAQRAGGRQAGFTEGYIAWMTDQAQAAKTAAAVVSTPSCEAVER